MALVAYGSSDESENDTDQDEDGQDEVKRNLTIPQQISANDNQGVSSDVSVTSPPARTSSVLDEDDGVGGEDDLDSSRPSLFDNIPKRKPIARPTYSKETPEEDEIVDPKSTYSSAADEADIGLHRPRPFSSVRTRFSLNLPAPKTSGTSVKTDPGNSTENVANSGDVVRRKKEGKSVKIGVPAISTFDSDEEEEIPAKKKIKQSSGLSGLFAVLPPPKNSVNKVMNRSLIPHTLTKKPNSSNSVAVGSNSAKILPSNREPLPVPLKFKPTDSEDEDDDYEDLGKDGTPNFFSLSEKVEPAILPADENQIQAESSIIGSVGNKTEEYLPAGVQDALSIPLPTSSQTPCVEGASMESDVDSSSAYDLSEKNLEDQMSDDISGPNPEGFPAGLPEFALREMQGKKRGRTQEDINIIDVSQDDQLPSCEEWLTKGLTEERASYSHRKKTHMPTSQQRRKHQITYLAFQAKERELELKNQWAQNRLTKRQTQSKYGF